MAKLAARGLDEVYGVSRCPSARASFEDMGIVMLVMLIAVIGFCSVTTMVAYKLGTSQLPATSAPDQDHRLAEQGERIELLESELQRLRDQADFTEKLLTERSGPRPRDALEEKPPTE